MIHVIDEMFPSIVRLRCWNHLLSDIDLWIKRHGGLKRDSSFYKGEARELSNVPHSIRFKHFSLLKRKSGMNHIQITLKRVFYLKQIDLVGGKWNN